MNTLTLPVLTGTAVTLRPITDADTDLIVKWRNTPSVVQNFIFRQTFTPEMHRSWLATKVATGRVVQYIILDNADGKPVGSVYYRDIDNHNRSAEYGIFIGEESARGKGLGTETARLFDWGFDNFSTRTVLESNELICEVPVALSNEVSTVAVHPASNAEAVLPNDLELDQLQRTVTLDNDSVNAPVAAGDQLGAITISYDGVDYVTVPLLAVADVSASSFLLAKYNIGQFFSRTPVKIITIVVVLLVIAALVWFRLYGRTRRYGRSGRRYRHHAYRGRRR